MAETMVVEGDDTVGITGTVMRRAEDKGSQGTRKAHVVLPPAEVSEFIRNRPSDAEGLKQLLFHLGFALAAAWCVKRAREEGSLAGLVAAELALGFVASFYFTGFHEMIHNTAFRTRWLNKSLAHVVGFFIFRGANWYWYFHWYHHRFTNDPERDPELSGTTVDRADPTKVSGMVGRVAGYALFLSGYPFGFERLPGIVRHALGCPLPETWIDHPSKRSNVQREYACFVLGYAALAALAVLRPETIGAGLFYYWLLPHTLGAGHLRYYQTAEHRACRLGSFTDTNAWIVSRTTATWWLYARLAWNMPYHSEHHAWPNVPFYLLPQLHYRVKQRAARPASGCNPSGEHGFLYMHWVLLQQVVWGTAEDEKAA